LNEKLSVERFSIIPYGSTLSGFGNKFSDLDICLIDKEAQAYDESELNKKLQKTMFKRWQTHARQILAMLFQALHPTSKGPNPGARVSISDSVIPGISQQKFIAARHPILTCHYAYMNMDFDISYGDPSVIEMSKLHNYYAGITSEIKNFVSILRIWEYGDDYILNQSSH